MDCCTPERLYERAAIAGGKWKDGSPQAEEFVQTPKPCQRINDIYRRFL